MSKPDPATVTRTLTIVLPESEWHALRTVEPDAIGWLREQIRGRLGSTGDARSYADPVPPGEPRWSTDEY